MRLVSKKSNHRYITDILKGTVVIRQSGWISSRPCGLLAIRKVSALEELGGWGGLAGILPNSKLGWVGLLREDRGVVGPLSPC